VAEESPADNVVVRAVEFEKEGFTDLKRSELLLPTRLPKVDFVDPIQATQEVEPITIRDSDEEAHTVS